MRRRDFIKVIGSGVIAWPLTVRAQQPERMHRVGVLMGYPDGDKQAQAGANALRKGLQDLGWTEGRNIQFDYRWPGPDAEKARTFAKELIGMNADVIVPSTNQVTAILQQETRTIPIVFAFIGDPVGSGFVQSLSRPGRKPDRVCQFREFDRGQMVRTGERISAQGQT
jgi:putative tryptophan/tyrosine transport system substrate-binding protein